MATGRSSRARIPVGIASALAALMLVAPAVLPAQERDQPHSRQSVERGHGDRGRARPAPHGRGDGAQPRPAPSGRPTAQPRPPAPRQRPGQRAHRVPSARPLWRAYPEPRFYGYERPRVVVPCITYPRPYYVFRPRLWIGFGIYIGVPVPYPIVYGYPPYVYRDGVVLGPPTDISMYGGLAFSIEPDEASVAIDGVFVGIARDFSPRQRPLTLTPGQHHVELQAPGHVPLAFEVLIVAGEVLPFQGTLQVD